MSLGSLFSLLLIGGMILLFLRRNHPTDLRIFKPKKKEVSAQKEIEVSIPEAPLTFDLEYRVRDITLCIKEGKGTFDLFTRIGGAGVPIYQTEIAAKSVMDALLQGMNKLELKL